MGGILLCWFRSQPDSVFLVAELLALGGTAAARRFWHDAANVVVEYADPGHGAGSSAWTGDGGVLHDVYGHGAIRCPARRCVGGPFGRAGYRYHGSCRLSRRRDIVWIAVAQNQSRSPPVDHRPRHDGRCPARRNDCQSGRRLEASVPPKLLLSGSSGHQKADGERLQSEAFEVPGGGTDSRRA